MDTSILRPLLRLRAHWRSATVPGFRSTSRGKKRKLTRLSLAEFAEPSAVDVVLSLTIPLDVMPFVALEPLRSLEGNLGCRYVIAAHLGSQFMVAYQCSASIVNHVAMYPSALGRFAVER